MASAWSAFAYSPRSRSAVASQWSAWKPISERPTCSASSAERRSERSAPSRSPLRQPQRAAQEVREAELAGQALALDQRSDRLGPRLDRLPFAAMQGQGRERGVELDLRRQVSGPLGDLERLAVGRRGRGVVGLGDLEVVAQRQERPDRLGRVGLARQLDRLLEVLASALGVADPPEHAPEDPVRAARRGRLLEALGQAKRLLRGVDREHVVAGVHVERGGLLVEADELEARRPVLQQVDAALVVADRAFAVALVPEPRADLAVEVADPRQILLAAVVLEALLPELDRAVHPPQPQRDVAELLGDPRPRVGVLGLAAVAVVEASVPTRSGSSPPGSSRGRRRRRRLVRARRARDRGSARARRPRGRSRRRSLRRGRGGPRPSRSRPRSGPASAPR